MQDRGNVRVRRIAEEDREKKGVLAEQEHVEGQDRAKERKRSGVRTRTEQGHSGVQGFAEGKKKSPSEQAAE